MIKVYQIKLQGMGDFEEKFVDQEAWDWITSQDPGQLPSDAGESSWEDQIVPDAVRQEIKKEYGGEEIMVTSGSWENDRAIMCPENVSIDHAKLDRGELRASLAAQGFEYTGEVYEGCLY